MIKKAGTPVCTNGWWLVPVSGAEVPSSTEPHDLTLGVQQAASPVHAPDADLIFVAFPISSPRKLRRSACANGGLGLIAVRVVTMDQPRHEFEHTVVLRERAGRIEALFGDPAPSQDVCHEICAALVEILRSALAYDVPSHSVGIAPSEWDIETLLTPLHLYPRLDGSLYTGP